MAVLLFIFISQATFSQSFLPAYDPAFGYKKGIIILKDSNRIEGTFGIINNTKNIKSCSIKDANGKKYALKAPQIEKVYILLSGLDRLNSYGEFTVTFRDLLNIDLKQVTKSEYFIWENVVTQDKGKAKVLQLVNPGYDSKIKIYRNPTAIQEGGDQFESGEEMSYYALKKGNSEALKVRKGDYDKYFQLFFSDCPELMQAVDKEKPRWSDFASHVFIYNQLGP